MGFGISLYHNPCPLHSWTALLPPHPIQFLSFLCCLKCPPTNLWGNLRLHAPSNLLLVLLISQLLQYSLWVTHLCQPYLGQHMDHQHCPGFGSGCPMEAAENSVPVFLRIAYEVTLIPATFNPLWQSESAVVHLLNNCLKYRNIANIYIWKPQLKWCPRKLACMAINNMCITSCDSFLIKT